MVKMREAMTMTVMRMEMRVMTLVPLGHNNYDEQ